MSGYVRNFMVAGLALLAGGCMLAPEYQRPAPPVPGSFASRDIRQPEPSAGDVLVDEVSGVGWRDAFSDPELQLLIETALSNNRNLRQTALNVAAYQARYRIQRSALAPAVSGTGSGTRQRVSDGDSEVTTETYSLAVGIPSWEIDFFGRLRSLKEQALEQYLAMEESHRSARVSLVAEVAATYLNLLADRELLKISEQTRRVEEESYKLVQYRVNDGIGDRLDLAQARTSLEAVKANLPLYRRQVAQDIHYLTLLTGQELPAELIEGDRVLTDVKLITVLPSSLDSTVLLHRPDIMAAEHKLRGANANIGAARAAFFPRVSLTAAAGVMSTEIADLFGDTSGTWSFSPTISIPIFNAGKLEAELDAARIQTDIDVVEYEYAIQNAFREVSDALAALGTYGEQLAARQANLEANEEYYRHARNRYEEGIDSFLTLLDAQRSLYAARQSYLALQLDSVKNRVNLYKVLGGGWKDVTVETMQNREDRLSSQ